MEIYKILVLLSLFATSCIAGSGGSAFGGAFAGTLVGAAFSNAVVTGRRGERVVNNYYDSNNTSDLAAENAELRRRLDQLESRR